MNAAAAIELRALAKDYGPVRALDGVDLEVRPGEIFGFLGPNGAGKTTAIRILFDLIRPSSGRALVFGIDCQREGTRARSRMTYLPGDLRLYDNLSGQRTIELFSRLRGGVDEAFLSRVVKLLGLDTARTVGEYSRGNRQKLGLVLALMHRPDLLVLDEPTSGLDPLVQEHLAELLRELSETGKTVFFSSHVLSEVERICHRAAILRRGRIVAIEDVADIKNRSLHILDVAFAAPPPAEAFRLEGVRELRREGNRVRLEVRSNIDSAVKAIARYPVTDLHTEQPSLDDVFLAYYDEEASAREAQDAAS